MNQIKHFDARDFLEHYWQQKPLLIRQGIQHTEQLISGDELAGLACEACVESRLVNFTQGQWQLETGPFNESRFAQLPPTDWTLLVQAVDHYSESIAGLMDYFRFIPNWRLDDIMVSYATDGGSVGPHYDNYDVFLVQGSGQREWQLGQRCDDNSPLLDHPDLLLLDQFNSEQTYLLSAGDVLYIPPRYAHWGIARGDNCITYSVGFRAPASDEIISEFSAYIADQLGNQSRYQDSSPALASNPGEINSAVIDQLLALVQKQLANREAMEDWFGHYMTAAKYETDRQPLDIPTEQLLARLSTDTIVLRDGASRFVYIEQDQCLSLFVNGRCWKLASTQRPLAQLLCDHSRYRGQALHSLLITSQCHQILQSLFACGALYFDHD